jgi:asparagine synthase (glutamine-hydrolysing)
MPWVHISGAITFEHDAVAVVADSNLYNYRELSHLVQGEIKTEAELIGLLYLHYGHQKLEGLFSIAIVDIKNQHLIIATDRFGTKPLYYFSDKRNFIFGSRIRDIRSIPQSQLGEIDYESLIDYVNLSAIPTPKTIYKAIRKLPPGHFLSLKRNKMKQHITQYYDINYPEEKQSENYFLSSIPNYIEESVSSILDYETSKGRSVGAFLSGGTDSSTVTGMIKKLTDDVRTFSIGFDEPGYDELEYARIAAKHFGAQHHEYVVTPEDALETLDILIDTYDEPFGNASAIPTYYCAKLAKEHSVDTLFAGDGGDEVFGGNERYATNNIFAIYHAIPSLLRKGILEPFMAKIPSAIPLADKGRRYITRANISQPERFFSYNPVMALGINNIFSPDILSNVNGYDPVEWARNLYDSVKSQDKLNKLLYIDMKFTMTDNDLRKVASMSERGDVKVVYPFLGHRLVDFAATIPGSLKVRGTRLRYIFKRALKGFLPPEILHKKKHGFGLPIGVWIKTKDNLSSFARETLLTPNCTIRKFFREHFIEELFALHRGTATAFYGDIIWLLLILELWNKRINNFNNLSITQ